jgi:hypothetical protein
MANSALRLQTHREPVSSTRDTRVVSCPDCGARLVFHPSSTPQIDACGFETVQLECSRCEASLAGVIDPCDGAVLLSVLPR